MRLFALGLLTCLPIVLNAATWQELLNGKDLTGWQIVGDGIWTLLKDGTLVGQREPRKTGPPDHWIEKEKYNSWLYRQAWLYTEKEYTSFDLELEYWLPSAGNSGISIRDRSRAQYAVSNPPDSKRTPSNVAYEIQLSNRYPDQYPSGSIYRFAKAAVGAQLDDQWNKLAVESRPAGIKVRINGRLVAEHAGDPGRPASGPIGLQLHDQYSVVMFRNIRLRPH